MAPKKSDPDNSFFFLPKSLSISLSLARLPFLPSSSSFSSSSHTCPAVPVHYGRAIRLRQSSSPFRGENQVNRSNASVCTMTRCARFRRLFIYFFLRCFTSYPDREKNHPPRKKTNAIFCRPVTLHVRRRDVDGVFF